jgi:hypothetical protein
MESMARHAGFAAAATIKEDAANSVIASYVSKLGPLLFPLPQVVDLGPTRVILGGIFELLPPTLELHANPGDLIIPFAASP